MKTDTELLRTRRVALGISVFVSIVVFFVVVSFFLKFRSSDWSGDPARWGQLGDYLGGLLNPTVAFAALLAVLYAVYLQRLELIGMRAGLDEQILGTKFFNAVSQYNDDIKALRYVSLEKGTEFTGNEALRECLYEFFYKMESLAAPLMKTGGVGFSADYYPLLAGYVEQYIGMSTPFMVVHKIINIADMVERSEIEGKIHYHEQFEAYLSVEVKIWVYLFFAFTERQGKIPAGYGCEATFMEYCSGKARRNLVMNDDVLSYICQNVRAVVNATNDG